MTDPRKVLAAKKAAILEQAEKQAAEIDRDLHEMERLATKYGLEFLERDAPEATEKAPPTIRRHENSPYHRGKAIAEKAIETARAPVEMADIWTLMAAQGVVIPGKNPKSKFSAYLGQRSRLTFIKGRGWWFKDAPIPKPGHPIQEHEPKAPESGELSGASRSNGTLPWNT